MPIFYKQDGTWKNVDSPYIKQNGQWVQPEQVYIKKNGRWKLIWEEFAFVVETVNSFENQNATVLEGQLSNFEDFGPDETFFFDQTLDEPITVEAVAVDEDRKLIALGGGDDTVYVYNNRLALERTTESPVTEVDVVQTLQEPSETVNEIDFYDNKNLVVASDSLYVYGENSNVVNTFTTDEGNEYTDVDVNSQNGTIAASTGGAYVYLYTEQEDGTWAFNQKLNNPLSETATSVSWKEDDGSLGVGTDQGQVYVYDSTFNPGDAQLIDQFTGNTKIEFSKLGTDGVSNWLAVVDEQELKVYSNGLNLAATITDSTEGPQGDVTWDENDYLAHASSDDRLYVYDGSNGSFDNFKTFDDPSESASRPFKSVSWDGQNEYIVGGTSKSGSGNAHLFSTGVRTFFDWSKQGEGFANRQRASGLRAVGTFETILDNLEPNQAYEFRAGSHSANERTVLDENGLTFVTVDLQVETEPVSSRQSTSATLNGKVTSFGRNSENPFVEFRYGKASEDLRNVQNVGFISPNVPTEVSFNVTNLESGQEYEYRIVSEFGGVTSFGDVETFTTRNVTAALSSAVTDPTDFGDKFISSDTEAETSTKTFTIIETSGTGSYSVAESDVTIFGQDAGDFTVITPSGSFPLSVSKDNPRDIRVEFSPNEDELQVANLEVAHNAANGTNPFEIGLQGTGELVPELQLEDNVVEAVVDGNENTAEVLIRETGQDYDATITSISEDPNQPAGTDTSKWSISNLPGDLSSGGTATVSAGEAVSFTVGFDPDTNSPQDYNIIVDYKGSGIRDDTVLNGTITGNIRGSIKAEFDPQRNGVIEDTSFNFDSVTSDGGTFVRDSSGPDVKTTVPFKIPGDSLGDFQVTELRIVGGDNPSDFTILNAPPEVQDGDPSTLVNVSETNELLFDVEFNPSAQNERNTNIEVEANNVQTSPVSISLAGTGLQPSEIVTDVTSLTFGDTIVGGNLSGERSIESVTVSNPSGDETFDVTNNSIISNEFNIENSIVGETLGENFASPVKEQVNAEVEFIPTGGTDGETVTGQYEIANNAEIGNDPVVIDLEGTVQITSLDFQTADGTSFDPTTAGPHFSVFGIPGQSASRDFEVSVLSENTASTAVSISGSNSGILNLNSDQQNELNPGGAPLVGTMNYDPTSTSDNETTEQVTVEWDNSNESETIQVEGLVDSTVDVQTPDASGSSNDGTLDFGSVTENNTKNLTVTVSEEVGNRNFDITNLGSLSSTGGPYSITSNFGASAPVTVSNGNSVSATIRFAPTTGDGGSTYTNTLSFDHDAAYAPSTYEESPVNITLTADALASASIVLTQDSDGSTPVSYSAEVGNTESVLINISEDGGNNDVTVDSFTVSDNGDGTAPFSLNSGYSNFDTTVPAGGSISEAVVEFAPASGTGSAPDFTVNGELTANYSGTGVPSGASASVILQGEVIRPATADISSSTNTPISFGSITVDPGNTVTETKEYTIVEENLKNSYNVTGISITGTESSSYTNLTNAPSGNDIASGDTVSAGGSLTGTVEFFFDSSTQNSGTYNATIELSHDAPEEGSSDTGSTSGVLEIPVFADVTVAQYEFTVSPTSHDFGTVGTATTKQFVIENTGNQTLSGFSVGSFSSQFLTKTSTIGTTTLDPGQTTSFTVEYDPVNETDTANETVTVSNSDPNTSDVDVTVQGDGFANETVIINPVSGTDFGNDGGTKDFEIDNTGNVDITVSTSLQTGTEFSITSGNLSNQTISPSETPPTVTVSYNPSTIDNDTDTLLVSGDASDSQSISGDGITETTDVSVTPTSLSFGTTDPAGNTVSVTVENGTNANVDATNLGVSLSTGSDPEFSIPNGISGSISPGSSKSFDVEYNPNTFNANDSGTAEVVYDNASQVQQTISVGLSGSGETESNLSVTTDNLGTVVNSSTTKTVTDAVTVSNSSTANRDASFTVTNVSGDTGEINILTSQFSTPITPGGQTSADVEYNPNDNTNDSITFDISSGDEPNPPSNVTVSGSGESAFTDLVLDSGLTISNTNAGNQASGTMSVTNNGNTSASPSLSATATSGGFDVSNVSISGSNSIGAGNTETYTVSADVNAAAADGSSVTLEGNVGSVSSSDSFSINNYDLTISSGLSLLDSNIDSSTSGTVTLANNGSIAYDLSDLSTSASTGDVLASASVDNAGTGTISSGSSKDFNVSSSPNEPDADDGDTIFVSVSLSDNGPLGDSQNASANYDVVAPVLSLGTNTLSFLGTQKAGTSISGSFTVENTGGMDSTVNTSTSSGIGVSNVSISPVSGSATVAAGGSTEFTVSADIDSSAPDQTQSSVGGTVTSTEDSDQSVSDSAQLSLVSPNLNVTATPSFPSTIYRGQSGFSSTGTIENNGSGGASVSASAEFTNLSVLDNNSVSPSNATISSGGGTQDFTYSFDTSGSGSDVTLDVGIEVTEDDTGETVISNSNEFTLTDPPSFSFNLTSYTIDESKNTGTVNFIASGTINQGESYSIDVSSGATGILTASDVDSGSASITDFNTTGGDTVTITLTRDFDGASGSGSVQALSDSGTIT